jgi:hypothetical protein
MILSLGCKTRSARRTSGGATGAMNLSLHPHPPVPRRPAPADDTSDFDEVGRLSRGLRRYGKNCSIGQRSTWRPGLGAAFAGANCVNNISSLNFRKLRLSILQYFGLSTNLLQPDLNHVVHEPNGLLKLDSKVAEGR